MASTKSRKREIPEGLWTKCKKCSTLIYDKDLDENLKICQHCGFHFTLGARERIHSLVETCSFEEMDADMTSVDPLQFPGYVQKIEDHQQRSGSKDAAVTATAADAGWGAVASSTARPAAGPSRRRWWNFMALLGGVTWIHIWQR